MKDKSVARRKFIKGALSLGVATAAALTVPSVFAKTKNEQKLKLYTIGTGGSSMALYRPSLNPDFTNKNSNDY